MVVVFVEVSSAIVQSTELSRVSVIVRSVSKVTFLRASINDQTSENQHKNRIYKHNVFVCELFKIVNLSVTELDDLIARTYAN